MGENKPGLSYKDAGVDIGAATAALSQIKTFVNRTFDDNVLRDIGSFGAMYRFDTKGMEEPVLVSSVDGVGTKLKLAFMMDKHDTIGIDLVSHCVNDILVQGARPIFFLDYLACGHLDPRVVVEVIKGLTNGCRYAGCALIGGETAEMPDMYREGEYDVAGTIVGVVDRKKIVDGSSIEDGDVIIGLASSGLHTNGYSLARKICFERAGKSHSDPLPGTDRSIGEALLEPHRSYAKVIQIITKIVTVKGMSHITGGGITDNLPRSLPDDCGAEIDLSAWEVPPIFTFLQEEGGVEESEMLHTFNMGMGYLIIVKESEAQRAIESLVMACEEPKIIGRVVKGDNTVQYTGNLRYATSR
jgi:phosphoribosylformylglycinamidine cyclo-ligase